MSKTKLPLQSCRVESMIGNAYLVQFHLTQGQLYALKNLLEDNPQTVVQAELAIFFNNALKRAGIDP